MQASKFWYQLTVHGKKAVVAVLLSLFFQRLYGQSIVYQDDVRFARRDFHFGISLGINFSNYKITLDSNYLTQNEILGGTFDNESGIQFGNSFFVSYF